MTGIADIAISARVVTMTVPVAVYFLILGLLHTRRRPQMLTGRVDFALLIAALSPLVFLPAMSYLGGSPLAAVLAAGRPGGGDPAAVARGAVVGGLQHLPARRPRRRGGGPAGDGAWTSPDRRDEFVADAGRITVTVEAFPLLRNATIRLTGGAADVRPVLPGCPGPPPGGVGVPDLSYGRLDAAGGRGDAGGAAGDDGPGCPADRPPPDGPVAVAHFVAPWPCPPVFCCAGGPLSSPATA